MTISNILTSNYDLIFLGIILFSAIVALFRGAIAEIFSLGVWIISFIVLHRFSFLLDKYIPNNITNPFLRSAIIFISSFIIIAILMAIIKHVCTSIINSTGLGGLNRFLGIVFGIVRGILICAVLVLIIEILKLDAQHSWRNAKLYPVISPVLNFVTHSIPSSTMDWSKENLKPYSESISKNI
ncbi:MAG: CvpA family protein [Burkholderiales bacterium]|nr:CvpA family protein [Burkholderiales bacterium]